MRLTIHRGTHEIGGSCVELCSDSGNSRIILDVGMPLVNPDMSPFDWNRYKAWSSEQLLEEKVLSPVGGLYCHEKPSVSAIVLSHAHQDHYGFFRLLHPSIPLHMSTGTKALIEVSNLFLDTKVNLSHVQVFWMWRPFHVGEFKITPYLMDHSAPDAAAFLIEADGKRVFYTGDFRGHGRKGELLQSLLANPISGVDCLIMEGSMIGRDKGLYPDEKAVEQAISGILADQRSYIFVFCSSQNVDRLVSIYRAVKRHRKQLVIDLYTAFVLDKLGSISSKIPQFDWSDIHVLWPQSHYKKIEEYDGNLLRKYGKSKIGWKSIKSQPQGMVVLAKDSGYFRNLLPKLGDIGSARAIYSMWHGYLERTALPQLLKSHGIDLIEIHTSGHAYVEDLEGLALALKPRVTVPIHTFRPEVFPRLFSNVIQLGDGEEMTV